MCGRDDAERRKLLSGHGALSAGTVIALATNAVVSAIPFHF
jgi:hypothetical protein